MISVALFLKVSFSFCIEIVVICSKVSSWVNKLMTSFGSFKILIKFKMKSKTEKSVFWSIVSMSSMQ